MIETDVPFQKWEEEKSQDPADVISWLLKALKENDQSAPPGEVALQEDGRLLIIAGRYVFS